MAKYIFVVLRMPSKLLAILIYAKAVLAAMTGNAKFPNATALLAVLATAIQALDKAINGGKAADRRAAREAVKEALNHLADHVQSVAETAAGTVDLEAVRATVESAQMDLRKVGVPQKQVFAAKYGPFTGCVDLTAPRSKARDPHEWAVSTDQHNWSSLPSTRKAKTRVTGLPAGVAHYFRHRTLTKDGYTEWSDPVMIVVK
jgi:hypothetical protein